MSTSVLSYPEELWRPKDISNSEIEKFRIKVNKKYQLNFVEDIQEFWAAVWDYTKIIYSVPYEQVLEDKPMDQIPAWFLGARLNFAENLLWCRDRNKVAIISAGESRPLTNMTYHELYVQVNKLSKALRKLGVSKGDRVGAYISNCCEAVIAMLATTSIGAIWSSTSTDFGVTGVLDRFCQIRPKILFSVNSIIYNEKEYNHLDKLKIVVEKLKDEGLEKVIVIPFVGKIGEEISDIPLACSWNHLISQGESEASQEEEIQFEQLPFDHPVYILFSSGTTGKPKCLVHRSGGLLIQHKKEHILHGNMTENDVFFYYTTTGWMMWNWLVSGLSVGCSIVLYDGSPFKPSPAILWKLTEQLGITIFGTSATYIKSLQDVEYRPKYRHELTKLRMILSTGSPLKPESFDFVYKEIKDDLVLGSITGGTDICSLFAGHNVTLPVHKGEIQCICLGMKVEAWKSQGNPVYAESADLVCTAPFPCMPIYFWNDTPSHDLYRSAYFTTYNRVWYHSDFIFINPNTGGLIMLGRSDGTLNPGGVRFGSAEIYNVIDKDFRKDGVIDSLVVGQKIGTNNKEGERVVLFLKMDSGRKCDKQLVENIKKKIRDQLSPRHVPSFILPIDDIPYTVNGKKVEIAVKKIISGETVVPSGVLANPNTIYVHNDKRGNIGKPEIAGNAEIKTIQRNFGKPENGQALLK
ncbi:10214_t:CDS:2 [Funneliformis geosporum]|uniref:6302_t:CDS:1 n=1 Tax=Funneliformis geosporum TaxID=1117311 RepID=A0A9W4WVB9_9GLOM|nr:10214_t:CDS:2 [Funneliformis geosporum]CAI2174854.1 6302_t:CDS:2 [Funneliformis geosporum]